MPADSANADLVIGVDGGGTKTIAWVAPKEDPSNTVVLGRGQAGPSNPRAVGFPAAQSAIDEAIAKALTQAGRTRDRVAAAWLGLAGAGREAEQQPLEHWALQEAQIADRVCVRGDAEPILAAASPDHCGIALIAGTGSLAWGRNAQGETARCGGWGYLLGDEGSAYAIAVAALKAAMQSADGRRPPTKLLPALLDHFHAKSPSELIDSVYGPTMTRDRLAQAAETVFAVAAEDVAARQVVRTAAQELADMVRQLKEQLGFDEHRYDLALTGGLLLNQSHYRLWMLDELSQRRASPQNVALVTDPVKGAVALARTLTQKS